jgi:hypothetical protein
MFLYPCFSVQAMAIMDSRRRSGTPDQKNAGMTMIIYAWGGGVIPEFFCRAVRPAPAEIPGGSSFKLGLILKGFIYILLT